MNNYKRITIHLAVIRRMLHLAGTSTQVVKVAFIPDAGAAIPVLVRARK